MFGHSFVSGFVRIVITVKILGFGVNFKLLDDAVCYFGLFSLTKASMLEESNIVISALAESIV